MTFDSYKACYCPQLTNEDMTAKSLMDFPNILRELEEKGKWD